MNNMTAKEKAQELFNKHYMTLFESDSDLSEEILISILARKAAIITVDEIIDAIDWNESETNTDLLEHFYKVKKEVETL
jgi:hypothetical protein